MPLVNDWDVPFRRHWNCRPEVVGVLVSTLMIGLKALTVWLRDRKRVTEYCFQVSTPIIQSNAHGLRAWFEVVSAETIGSEQFLLLFLLICTNSSHYEALKEHNTHFHVDKRNCKNFITPSLSLIFFSIVYKIDILKISAHQIDPVRDIWMKGSIQGKISGWIQSFEID